MVIFAGMFVALYVGAQIGDFWVQSSNQAAGKGKPGREGRMHCAEHCFTYVASQGACVTIVMWVTGQGWGNDWLALLAFAVSGVAHYAMDRREHGILPWLTRVTRKEAFAKLGAPRDLHVAAGVGAAYPISTEPIDAPHLGTGAFALDQSWHVLTSMFIPALLLSVTL